MFNRFLKPLPIAVLLLTLSAFAAVTLLGRHAESSKDGQLRVTELTLALTDLQSAPFEADQSAGGRSKPVQRQIRADTAIIAQGLSPRGGLDAPEARLAVARTALRQVETTVQSIYRLAASETGLVGKTQVPVLKKRLTDQSQGLYGDLDEIGNEFADRADWARRENVLGTAAAMFLLVGVFSFFYFRSRRAHAATQRAQAAAERLAAENQVLLGESQMEASTDELTGIGNRRALMNALSAEGARSEESLELILAIFDLDGFKQYNDSFGHAAGDELLARFGQRLSAVLEPDATAYRMGGDEFCVLARSTPDKAEGILARAVEALYEEGEGWKVGCSYGAVWVPSEAETSSEALRTADRRMYADKASRSSASRQITDVLLQVLSEQRKNLGAHVAKVADLSGVVARRMQQPRNEIERIRLAATLHDVGKAAVPAAILNRPGPLTDQEWEFVRCHPVIGERIVLAAPALAATAPYIRSSQERFDGTGYPDRLAADEIPLGARIIAVCAAFEAMTSTRPYRESIDADAALEELRRCAGTQFDPSVVSAFGEVVEALPKDLQQA